VKVTGLEWLRLPRRAVKIIPQLPESSVDAHSTARKIKSNEKISPNIEHVFISMSKSERSEIDVENSINNIHE
jgi:hypothetical protein